MLQEIFIKQCLLTGEKERDRKRKGERRRKKRGETETERINKKRQSEQEKEMRDRESDTKGSYQKVQIRSIEGQYLVTLVLHL